MPVNRKAKFLHIYKKCIEKLVILYKCRRERTNTGDLIFCSSPLLSGKVLCYTLKNKMKKESVVVLCATRSVWSAQSFCSPIFCRPRMAWTAISRRWNTGEGHDSIEPCPFPLQVGFDFIGTCPVIVPASGRSSSGSGPAYTWYCPCCSWLGRSVFGRAPRTPESGCFSVGQSPACRG